MQLQRLFFWLWAGIGFNYLTLPTSNLTLENLHPAPPIHLTVPRLDATQLCWGQPRTDVGRETLGALRPSRQHQSTSNE